jgi:AAA ATPase domain
MLAFPSASEAVKCAVAIQQAFERRYRDAEQALHIRVGLGAGESTLKDGDYFGMPSIEAARLCAQAPADGILISATVKLLAGRCEGIDFSSVGELELKGFEEPVQAFAVSWAPLAEETGAASRWPLPALLRSVPVVSYVGRAEERAALQEALNLARNGQRQVVLLSGESGIGKTRLASYAVRHAHAEGFAVCWGACTEELAAPYEPWIEICSHLIEHAPRELLQRHMERHQRKLGRAPGRRRRVSRSRRSCAHAGSAQGTRKGQRRPGRPAVRGHPRLSRRQDLALPGVLRSCRRTAGGGTARVGARRLDALQALGVAGP